VTRTFGGGGGGQTTASPLVTNSGATQPSSTHQGGSAMIYSPSWGKILIVALLGFMTWFWL
jgi:hypothetical protein